MIIKGFLLDLDGVITKTSEYHYQAWKELAAELNITVDYELNECLKGVSRMDSLNIILQHGNVCDKYTCAEKEKLAERKNFRYVELLKQLTPKDILPSVGEFLNDARQHSVKLGIASASKNARFILEALDLKNSIDFIADAAKVQRSKPFPDIFLMAAEGLGLSAKYCIGLEDSSAGIKAIHAAGMRAVGIGSQESLYEADLLLNKTSDLSFSDILNFFN